MGKKTTLSFWHRACRKLDIICPSDKILQTLWVHSYRKNAKINQEVILLAKELGKKYALAVVSNTIKEHTEIDRKRGIFHHFDVVLLSCEVGLRKPQKEIFQLASKKLKIPLTNLLFIDDDMRWIKVARRFGLQSILFKSTSQLKRKFKKLQIF